MGTLPTPPNCTQGPPQSLPSPSTSAPLLPPTPPTSAHTTPLPAPPPLTSEAVQADREPAGGGGAVEQQLFRPRAVPPPLQLGAAPPELPVKARVDQLLRLRGEGGGAVRRPQTQFGITDPIGDPRPN